MSNAATPEPDEPRQIKFVQLLESDLPKLLMSGFLSRRATFTVRVDGPFSLIQFDRLIKLMEAHRDVMRESEDEQ